MRRKHAEGGKNVFFFQHSMNSFLTSKGSCMAIYSVCFVQDASVAFKGMLFRINNALWLNEEAF